MRQMPLFSAEAEATRTLQEQFDVLCHDYRYVEARLEQAKVEFRKLRDERDALKAKEKRLEDLTMDALTRADMARREVEYWRTKVLDDMARGTPRRAHQDPAPFLDQVLKHLIRLAHPDHWQRGQPATELAHELLVALNDARAQLEAQL
jgi:hypothetical protein